LQIENATLCAMRNLRLLLFALLIASVLLAASRAFWEAHLVCPMPVPTGIDRTTFIIDLQTRPIWSPPTVPTYDIFRQSFSELPVKAPSDAVSLRIFRYDETVFLLILFAAVSSAVCGLLYLFIRRGVRDVVLHYALFVAAGYFSFMLPSYPLWCWGGGMVFSFFGVGLGIILGTILWMSRAPNTAT
jgi:hypothetical protein